MKNLIFIFTALALPWASHGQEYPSKPVRVVVPYVAGGAADIFARTLGQKLSEAFKQGFVVENKPGANGGIGAAFVAKSAPDGYTLLATASGPIVVNPALYANLPYDPVRDFVPIAQATVYQYVLVALADSPLRGIDDVVAAARARPGAITYGSTGFGGGNHLAGELLALKTNTRLTHVPYKGSAGGGRGRVGAGRGRRGRGAGEAGRRRHRHRRAGGLRRDDADEPAELSQADQGCEYSGTIATSKDDDPFKEGESMLRRTLSLAVAALVPAVLYAQHPMPSKSGSGKPAAKASE